MLFPSFLAFLNGFLIGANRVLNARLGLSVGPIRACVWNHVVGFAFLLPVVGLGAGFAAARGLGRAPPLAFLGGAIGALLVVLSNWTLPRLGATRATILVISGQMLAGTLVDGFAGKITSLPAQALGVLMILLGISFGLRASQSHD
jgi:transporter family-2 protein